MVRRTRWMRGSLTVEMSYLMPLTLLLLMSSILAIFYFHDKNILAGAAYETAAVAGTKIREKEKTDTAQIEALFYERTEGKYILFPTPEVSIEIGDREIIVTAAARRGEFGLSVEKKIPVTEPEKTIRDRKRLKEIGNGTKNYN